MVREETVIFSFEKGLNSQSFLVKFPQPNKKFPLKQTLKLLPTLKLKLRHLHHKRIFERLKG